MKTYVCPAETFGMLTLTVSPEIMPATLTTSRPEMKVTNEPFGMGPAAVKEMQSPPEGRLGEADLPLSLPSSFLEEE